MLPQSELFECLSTSPVSSTMASPTEYYLDDPWIQSPEDYLVPSTTSSKKSNKKDQAEISKTNLYVSGLKVDATDEDIKALFHMFGNIISAKSIIDKDTNQCKGYGFVMFDNEESTKAALEALHRSGAKAAYAKVTRAQLEMQMRQESDPTNLYIANLPKDMEEQGMATLLVRALEGVNGDVLSCRVLRDENGISRGVGLARMSTRQACEMVIGKLSGKPCPGSSEKLRVKYANCPSPRRNQQHARRHDDPPLPAYLSSKAALNIFDEPTIEALTIPDLHMYIRHHHHQNLTAPRNQRPHEHRRTDFSLQKPFYPGPPPSAYPLPSHLQHLHPGMFTQMQMPPTRYRAVSQPPPMIPPMHPQIAPPVNNHANMTSQAPGVIGSPRLGGSRGSRLTSWVGSEDLTVSEVGDRLQGLNFAPPPPSTQQPQQQRKDFTPSPLNDARSSTQSSPRSSLYFGGIPSTTLFANEIDQGLPTNGMFDKPRVQPPRDHKQGDLSHYGLPGPSHQMNFMNKEVPAPYEAVMGMKQQTHANPYRGSVGSVSTDYSLNLQMSNPSSFDETFSEFGSNHSSFSPRYVEHPLSNTDPYFY